MVPRRDSGLNLDLVKTETPVWQDYFIIFELGRAKEKGFPAGPLLSWLAVVLTGQFQDPQYDPANLIRYFHPVRDASGAFYRRWSDMLPAFRQPLTLQSLHDVSDGYGSSAYAASTMTTHEPGGGAPTPGCVNMSMRPKDPSTPKTRNGPSCRVGKVHLTSHKIHRRCFVRLTRDSFTC